MTQQKMKLVLALVTGMTVTMISTATIAETSWYNEIDKTTSNVNNELSDTAISKKIEETLLPNPSIDSGSLSIRTEFGHVTVAGFVKNAEQEKQIIQIIEKIDGVKSVESSVNIQG